MQWQINQAYDSRLTSAYEHLQELEDEIDEMNKRYRSFVRTRQAATQSYEGYAVPIQQLRTRIKTAQINLRGIMARQGRMLETLAINELDRRRKRLEEYQVKARFALAESYDRATKAQEKKEIEALQSQAKEALKNAEPVTESNVRAEQNIAPGDAP
jgi:chromosome segregation ATPase